MRRVAATTLALTATTLLANCSAGEASTEPDTFTVDGSLLLNDGAKTNPNASCSGRDGYEDITAGAQVRVLDGDGTKVALGELDPGQPRIDLGRVCEFEFTVDDVPAGSAVYTVEVSHRGGFDFTQADATGLQISLG